MISQLLPSSLILRATVLVRRVLTASALLLLCTVAQAQNRVHVAIVSDGQQYQFQQIDRIFRAELVALAGDEFQIEFSDYSGEWTREGILEAFEDAYRNPAVDIVLALGFTANQIAVSRERFPKPTFLPLVFDAELTGAPASGNTSGKRNLNYLAERVSLVDELETYQRIVPFKKATVLIDQVVFESLDSLTDFSKVLAASVGSEMTIVSHDGSNHNLLERVPADTDAVLYTGLPRLPPEAFDALVEELIQRRLPAFSMADREAVVGGLLASDTVETDWQRLGRRNALNIQAVLIGERTRDQPVFFLGKQELTINMETARRIGLSPRFDVLSEATLLNPDPPPAGIELSLESVSQLALRSNLDLRGESLNVAAGEFDVAVARSGLFPQISAGASSTRRRTSPSVSAGLFPEETTDGSLGLSQMLYADDTVAAVEIQTYSQEALVAGFDAVRLDTVQEATQSYISALRAETQLEIQQDNLELTKSNLDLARDRVRIGTSTNADVFRWQSNLASARSQVLLARAALEQAREALNRVLNRPVTEPFRLGPAAASDPFSMSNTQFDVFVNNPRAFSWATGLLVNTALERSPELAQIDAQIAAKDREITNRRRDFWLPDFSLDTQYTDNVDQSGLGSGGLSDGEHDWSVSVNATLPLFSGGRRRSELSRSRLESQRLDILRQAQAERIDQQVRSAMHAIGASYRNIDLSKEAAVAAKQNLELVTDAYARGALSIIDLLDAQNQSLSADLSANSAVYDFLSDALTMQRAVARYDFLLSADEKDRVNKQLEDHIAAKQAEVDRR